MRKQIKLSAVIGTCLIFALLLLAVSAVSPVNAANSVTLSFTELATHPQAAAQSTSTGKQINKLKIFNNKLFVGFGDYGSNTGPISINPFDLTTNSFDGETVSVPTESLGNWKEINGRLYTTTIDPTCSATCPAGYAVSDDGVSWIVKTPINAEHIFDVETLTGTDIWLFGSAGGPTAKAWRSIDDGETWSVVQTYENVPGDNNTERYYWGVALSGSMYMQSNYGGYQNPLQIFDGTSWSEDTTDNLCPTGSESKGPNPVVFNSSIYCKYSSGEVTVFDNSNHSTSAPDFVSARDCSNGCSSSSNDLGDMIVSGDYLYILNSYFLGYDDFLTQELVRTSDGSSWESFDGIPSTASSIEIDESANKIYVGTSDSKILVADLPDPDVSAPEVSISSPSSNTTHTGSLNIVADATDDLYVNKVEFYLDGELISSKTQSPYTATLTDRLLSNGNWSLAGQHTITAKAYDFAGNSSTSEPVNISFQTPALNVTQYQTGNPHFGSTTLTVADDGDIWFYDVGDPFMGENDFRFASLNTRTGQTTHFPFPEGLSSPNILFNDTVVNGRNNSLWYPNCNDNKLVNIIPATGDYTEYDITTGCSDSRIVIASDSEGSVYYSRPGGDTLAKISYDGQASIISTPENFSVAAMSTSSTGQIIILLGNSENGTFISKLAKINQNDELDSYYTSDETNPEETAVYGGDILLDKEGNTWVSSYPTFDFETPQLSKVSLEGDITRYSSIITENDISGNLQLAPNGDIWFQTSKGVVARFTPNSEDYETYSLLTPFDTEIIGEEINIYLGQYSSMAVDQLGNTWICDSVGNRFIKISSTVAAPDSGGSEGSGTNSDSDTIPDSIEQAAPNNGDGNNDGTPDSQQSNVTSLPDPKTGKYITLMSPSGTTLTSTSVVAENTPGSTNDDTSFDYPLGLVSFTLDGVTPGSTNDITIYYSNPDNTDPSSYVLRKHNPNTKTTFTIGDTVLSSTTINNIPTIPTITASYQVTDGQDLDIDGEANGTIVDPVGLATTTGDSELSGTGDNTNWVVSLAGVLFISTTIYTRLLFRRDAEEK